MIDWNELEQLYAAYRSDNEKVRATAQAAIDSNIARWLKDYAGDPDEKEFDAAKTLDELGTWTLGWLVKCGDETYPEFFARQEELKKDKLGVLLRHRKHAAARKLHQSDWDFVTLYGDRFYLSLTPAHGKKVGLPDPPERHEFTLPDDYRF